MNRNLYKLVFNPRAGRFEPKPESARGRGKRAGGGLLAAGLLAAVVFAPTAWAVLPVPGAGGVGPAFVGWGQASYTSNGKQAIVSQVGNSSILNWQSFNVSAGSNVQFRQVNSLASNTPLAGASFTSLNRIWDANPSMIAGSISQAPGQQANVILVNTNGIAFMNGAQVNLNSFTASSLNIADKYITGSLLGDNTNPQFQMDPSATPGFVAVLEGAQITAGSQGRVMLLAPTVINRGSIVAPDGQIILAAGAKAYLRSNDNSNYNLRGLLVEVDSTSGLKGYTTQNASVPVTVSLDGVTQATAAAQNMLGMASNSGSLYTPRGNITMVGLAVNQSGIARATTSVVSNGSVYLMAKDSTVDVNTGGSRDSLRAGQVVLGAKSRTEILIDTTDTTTTTDNVNGGGSGLDRQSEVNVIGKSIYMDGTAAIAAPNATVSFLAIDNPSRYGTNTGPLQTVDSGASADARVHIASGASIDVSGLENVEVSVARNMVQIQLRGDELKDSPVNQNGPLRGQTVYVDINKALANSNAGKATLIAADSLQAYANQLQRTVAERATTAGTVHIQSEGQTLLESGVRVNISGGSVNYTGATVQQSLLSANGVLTTVADALATTRYTGIPTSLSVNYGRWNHTDVFTSGALSSRYEAGYVEGRSAGTLSIQSMGSAVMQASVLGKTTTGDLQRASGASPTGATLQIGADIGPVGSKDYKINEAVTIRDGYSSLLSGLGMDVALPTSQSTSLELDSDLLNRDGVANLAVYSNAEVSTTAALQAADQGKVLLTGTNIHVGGDIVAHGGTIGVNAIANAFVDPNHLAQGSIGVYVADGVNVLTSGTWTNDRAGVAGAGLSTRVINGGNISLTALSPAGNGVLQLGTGVHIDASAGASLNSNQTTTTGAAGSVGLKANAVQGANYSLAAYGFKQGGSLALTATRIKLGGATDSTFGTLNLSAADLQQGGFANYNLTAIDSLEVAAGTQLAPIQSNLQLTAAAVLAPSTATVLGLAKKITLPNYLRKAVNLTLQGGSPGAGVADLLVGYGASINMDPGATLALRASNIMQELGSLTAKGGTISLTLDQSGVSGVASVKNLLWLGSSAVLDVSGTAITHLDNSGGLQGTVLAGGTVNLNANTGYVMALQGSRINVAGAPAMLLNVRNETGGLGNSVASDAGLLHVFAEEGMVLDSTIQAKAGSTAQRGGAVEIGLSRDIIALQPNTYDSVAREMHLVQTQTPLVNTISQSAPVQFQGVVRADIAWDRLQESGADQVQLSSRDAIVLEAGLQAKAAGNLPLRALTLDAARIVTNGGAVALSADTVSLGNSSQFRMGSSPAAAAGRGVLEVDGRKVVLAGNMRLDGMAQTDVHASELIELDGVTRISDTGVYSNSGNITSNADLLLDSPLLTTGTYSSMRVNATGHTVTFHAATGVPYQPLTAAGSLLVSAQNIDQGGNLVIPFGNVDLEATGDIVLESGSLISLSGLQNGVLPLGQMVNGKSWIENLAPTATPNGQIPLAELARKSITLHASGVQMQSGATVDVSGGGDLQAYEFTVGPGGSKDILAGSNIYAILPTYAGSFASADPQEKFNQVTGTSIHLTGVPGLVDGNYVLLPAHYALLPGAYAVRLNTGVTILPGQSYIQQDGTRIAAAYLTDTRTAAPRDANWQGVQVFTGAQVHAASELTSTKASSFFAGASVPADAGNVTIATSTSGGGNLNLAGKFVTTAAAGGQGAQVDISAPRLAVIGASSAGIDATNTTILSADTLNTFGAASLLLGATRTATADGYQLQVGASHVTMANDTAHPLAGTEVVLAATDTLELRAGSLVEAQGANTGTQHFTTPGMGALLRVANSDASFVRTNSPGNSQGTLLGDVSSVVRSSHAITLDATMSNAFAGQMQFSDKGRATAGSLSIGAQRFNFGKAPSSTDGISYSQAALDALAGLSSMSFTSYSTFDFYGDVRIGSVTSKPTLGNLYLHGAGLAALSNSGSVALRATNITLDNPGGVAYLPGGNLGSEQLALAADTLILGDGNKTLGGLTSASFSIGALIGSGSGATNVDAPLQVHTALIEGYKGSAQSLVGTGVMVLDSLAAQPVAVADLGGQWSISGSTLSLNTQISLPSGTVNLSATLGDLSVGAAAVVDVAGRQVSFFDQTRSTTGGNATLTSAGGNLTVNAGAKVDVGAAPGANGGSLAITAPLGAVNVAAGTLSGNVAADANGAQVQGSQIAVDAGALSSVSALLGAVRSGGFSGAQTLRVRNGDVTIAAGDAVTSQTISVSADRGRLDVYGSLSSSGTSGGSIGLYAQSDVNLHDGASLSAVGSTAGSNGGKVELGSVSGNLTLQSGSHIDESAGIGGLGGVMNLRAQRTGGRAGTDVAISAVDATVLGVRNVTIEAVQIYADKQDLLATGTGSGSGSGATLTLNDINTDNTAFIANKASITSRLSQGANTTFDVRAGVEVRSATNGSLTLGADWNLGTTATRPGGSAGMLTLRSAHDLNFSGSLSDGFSSALPLTVSTPATVRTDDSWGYRLVSGADFSASSVMATGNNAGDFNLAAGKLIRTGTGDINIAAAGNITLADAGSVIYTAGKRNLTTVGGFVAPPSKQAAFFTYGGGDVSLRAGGSVSGSASQLPAQLYTNWLFREGELATSGSNLFLTGSTAGSPAWWVRFDQFRQGVATLGGGNVSVTAGGTVSNLSLSSVTQGRVGVSNGQATLYRTGGGNVSLRVGGDLLGGTYLADGGNLLIQSAGRIDSALIDPITQLNLYPVLAVTDGRAQVTAVSDLTVQAVVNPTLLPQSYGGVAGQSLQLFNVAAGGTEALRKSTFSTYGSNASVSFTSLGGNVTLAGAHGSTTVADMSGMFSNLGAAGSIFDNNYSNLLDYMPPQLALVSLQGNVSVGRDASSAGFTLAPSAVGQFDALARGSVRLNATVTMSDSDPALLPSALAPSASPAAVVNADAIRAAIPVHVADASAAHVYAVNGDVQGNSVVTAFGDRLVMPKALWVEAGRDVIDLNAYITNSGTEQTSKISAGRDITFEASNGGRFNENDYIKISGWGNLDVVAGRNLALGTSGGIRSIGNLENANLPTQGADIHLAAGVGSGGIDYAGAVTRILDLVQSATVTDAALWQARWLVGDESLSAANAAAAVQSIQQMTGSTLQQKVRNWLYTAMRTTGRDYNLASSKYAGDYTRGYAALELLFPGIGTKSADGRFTNHQGSINLFASRVKSESGGSIDFMVPGGDLVVGLANTPAALVNVGNNVLGIAVGSAGNVDGFARGDITVNQSRILTVGGGDLLLWSSEGGIDAGKGKKTASAVPPPVITIDAKGNVLQILQGAATGSGIGALAPATGVAGNVDLIAPKGTVNAGDAGIRAGNLNVAALDFKGADNVTVSGHSTGVPVADVSAVTAAASGATSMGDDASKSIAASSQAASEAARSAQQMASSFKPSIVSVDVLGYGE